MPTLMIINKAEIILLFKFSPLPTLVISLHGLRA
jgi:hypothetical protein